MATQVPVNLVNGGGALTPLQIKKALCKAFREAVAEHCSNPPGKRGSFNDKFYKKLRNVTPHGRDIAKSCMREVPVLCGKAGTAAAGVAGTAADLAATGNPLANMLNNAFNSVVSGLPSTGVSGLAGAGNVAASFAGTEALAANGPKVFFSTVKGSNFNYSFPDGMIGKQCIEIKGPADSLRPDQKAQYDAVSQPNPTIVVDCKSCGANCKNGPFIKMKGKWKQNVGCP